MSTETGRSRTVFLSGTPSQMGMRHGQLLTREIRLLVKQMHLLVFRRVGTFRGACLGAISLALALAMNRHIPPHLREEMRGIASGSGVSYLQILLLNTLDDVLNILRRLAPQAPNLACSSFALFGRRCQDRALMHGRNLDYHFRGTPLDDQGAVAKLLRKQNVIIACHPQDHASFLSLGWPGLVGAATAINQEGISLGNLTSYVRGTTPNGTPAMILYRLVMEKASTLHEAGQLLRAARRTIGNNVMVGSGKENSAALFELVRDVVEEVAPSEGMLIATNHFLSPALRERQRPFLLAHSVARWERLRTLCNRWGIDLQDALAFLADEEPARGERGEHATNPFARIANEGTAVSALFRPTEMELWIGTNDDPPASRGGFRRIDVHALLSQSANDPGRIETWPATL